VYSENKMIPVTTEIALNDDEIRFDFVKASGPGGQNVNKVATAVKLYFDIDSSSLPDEVRKRLHIIGGRRVTGGGILVINARRYRTQERNRQNALDRLTALIKKALRKPKPRRRTKPTAASREKRLQKKKQRGEVKKMRRTVEPNEGFA